MPKLKLTNLSDYKQYWTDIATSHKQIDGYYYGDKDVVGNAQKGNAFARFLWITPYENTRYTDALSDNIQKKKKATIAYFKKTPSNKFTDIDTTFQECESVIEDIVSKLILDKKGQDVNGTWTMVTVDINSLQMEPVEEIFGSNHYIGCELSMEFSDNTNISYDPNKWNA